MDTLMRRFFLFTFLLSLFLAACGAAPQATQAPFLPFAVTITDTPVPAEANAMAVFTAPPTATFTPEPSATPQPTATEILPTPTETLLPPLELPTEKPFAPAYVAWTGEPTYPGDSETGRLFRVDYDPDLWAQTEGNYGEMVLAHRQIEYCSMTAWSGRGLPADWKVEHEFREIGAVPYDVNVVTFQNEVKFVAYVGSDKRIVTGFQVTFQEQKEACLAAAEVIFATLRSFAAEPTVTPTFTLEPTATGEVAATPTP
jgi:hypothetical protein